jgi:hypothetical protein
LDIIPSAHVPHNELEDSASANPSSDEEEEEDTADPAEKIKRLKVQNQTSLILILGQSAPIEEKSQRRAPRFS